MRVRVLLLLPAVLMHVPALASPESDTLMAAELAAAQRWAWLKSPVGIGRQAACFAAIVIDAGNELMAIVDRLTALHARAG